WRGPGGPPAVRQLRGLGPREPLERAGVTVLHELPAGGANLLDHLANGLLVRTKDVETLASAEALPNLVRWALRGRGPLTSNVGEAVGFVRPRARAAGLASRTRGSRRRASPLARPVRERGAHAADGARPHVGRDPPRAAELGHRPPPVGRSTHAPGDRPALPHR